MFYYFDTMNNNYIVSDAPMVFPATIIQVDEETWLKAQEDEGGIEDADSESTSTNT